MSRGFALYESMLRDERCRSSAMQEEFSRMLRRVRQLEAENKVLAAENARLKSRLAKRRRPAPQSKSDQEVGR